MLGILKADVDSLGSAISEVLRTSSDSRPLKLLSDRLDHFFAEQLEEVKSGPNSRWSDVYTVFSGGDDLLAVGPWDIMIDFAGYLQTLFDRSFGAAARRRWSPAPLTLSAGLAITKPRHPVHLAAEQADHLLDLAKEAPKDQFAALGETWNWKDHDRIVFAGKRLADWVEEGAIQRTWIHTVLDLALLRRGWSQSTHTSFLPASATSRLAYHVERNWPKRGSEPRLWIDKILLDFDSSHEVETTHLPAILRYALLATRANSLEALL